MSKFKNAQKSKNCDMPLSKLRYIVIIFCFALFLRIIFCISFIDSIEPLMGDAIDYNRLATNIINGLGFTNKNFQFSARRPPLYPIFLSIVYLIFGVKFLPVIITQSVINVITCYVIFCIAKNIFNNKIAFISFAISSVYPYFIYYSKEISTEILFIFLLVLMIYFLVQYHFIRHKKYLIFVGVLLGLCNLCRPTLLLFPFFIFLWLFIIEEFRFFRAITNFLILFIFMTVVISPWTIRNYLIFKKIVPVAATGGMNLWMGNNPKATWHDSYEAFNVYQPTFETEVDRDRYFRKLAIKYILENPKRVIFLSMKKFFFFWSFYVPKRKLVNNLIAIFSYGVLLPFFLVGCISKNDEKEAKLLLIFLILYYTLIHMILVVTVTRYRLPIDAFTIIISCFGMERIYEKIK